MYRGALIIVIPLTSRANWEEMSLLMATDLFLNADVRDRFWLRETSPLNKDRFVTNKYLLTERSFAIYTFLLKDASICTNSR